jgi:hypothetical protein
MTRKDKRSLLLSLVLGDGCLHYIKNNGKVYGGLTIDHGIAQSDYQKWKAQLVSSILGRDVKVRTGHRGKSIQISASWKRFKAWRKFCYPNGRKSMPRILRFIQHPEFAIGVLLMDDGYCEPGLHKNKEGKKILYSARLRIFVCSQTQEEVDEIILFFKNTLNITFKKYMAKDRKTSYPYLKLDSEQSLVLWSKIRDFVLQHKSMQYKFRYIEQIYQRKLMQRKLGEIAE